MNTTGTETSAISGDMNIIEKEGKVQKLSPSDSESDNDDVMPYFKQNLEGKPPANVSLHCSPFYCSVK